MASVSIRASDGANGARLRFVITIFAGSFLLFLIQPMIARMALPRLGGAPAVWNSAMLVYQALLLAGYAYAHWLGRFAVRTQAAIHVGQAMGDPVESGFERPSLPHLTKDRQRRSTRPDAGCPGH